jgi:opacity protein-like surface antigen
LHSIASTFTFVLVVLAAHASFAQNDEQTQKHRKFEPSTDVSIGTEADLTATRMPTFTHVYSLSGTGITQVMQSAAPSAGVFGSFHQSFTPWLGYNVHFGFTRFTEHYSNAQESILTPTTTVPASSSFIRGNLRTNMYDLTVSSAIEGPRTKRISTFTEVGGGGLFFTPLSTETGASRQTRPALVFGVGANFKLSPKLDLRAEYRGLFYKSPDFNLTDITPGVTGTNQFPMTRLFTVTSTPEVSLVYHFGRTKPAKAPVSRP